MEISSDEPNSHTRLTETQPQSEYLTIPIEGMRKDSRSIVDDSESYDLNKTITEEDENWDHMKESKKRKTCEMNNIHTQSSKDNLIDLGDYESISDKTIEHIDPTSPEFECEHVYNQGRWSSEEHSKFMEALLIYGNEWKKLQTFIKSRSSAQIRSHAQKFLIRLKKLISEDEDDDDIIPLNDRIIQVFKDKMKGGYLPKNFDQFTDTIISLIGRSSDKRKISTASVSFSQQESDCANIKDIDDVNMKQKNIISIINPILADHENIDINIALDASPKPDKIFRIEKIKKKENEVNNMSCTHESKSFYNEDTKGIKAKFDISTKPQVNSFINIVAINLPQDINQKDNSNPFNINFDELAFAFNLRENHSNDANYFFGSSPLCSESEARDQGNDFDLDRFFSI